jgi:hypothetical protein
MGCDFKIVIEVLHRGKWIPIVLFGTKTPCGGFPLTSATFDLYKQIEIKGDYCANDSKISPGEDVEEFILGIFESSRDKKNQGEIKNDNKHEEDEDDEEEYEVKQDDEKPFLYYSCSQFEKLISLIKPLSYAENMIALNLPQMAMMMPRSSPENDYQYLEMMKPMSHWMKLAKSVLPVIINVIFG